MPRPQSALHLSLRRPQTYVCPSCLHKRWISTTFLQKQKEAKEQWAQFATEIRAKKRKSMLSILEERGFIHAIAGERNTVDKLMIDKRIGVYCGIDPTAPSLHVGHMLPLMALFWMHVHGFHTISLIGGATASIGDPTGRTTDRPVMTSTERKANITSMHFQVKRLWVNLEGLAKTHGYHYEKYWKRGIENNSIWWNNVTFLEVLKLLGRGLRLGTMLTRDTVKTKMDSGDGMSFAEFCYPIMQAWDWWRMYNAQGIQMQIGGSDQFGNIVAGIDAVKFIAKNHPDPDTRQEGGVHELNTPYGFTVPLLTTASGAKFGKSAGNAVWLDQSMTSLFDLYGFFVRTADADVERYLKLFTFLTLPQIQGLMAKHKTNPSERIPQHRLAYEFVALVHGADAAKDAESQHKSIFRKSSGAQESKTNPLMFNQNPATREQGTWVSSILNKYAAQSNASNSKPGHIILPKSLVYDQPVARVLHAADLVTSRSEGHRLAEAQGAYIGMRASGKEEMSDDVSFTPAKVRDPMQTWSHVIQDLESEKVQGEEGLLILRVGKWKVRICRIVSDEKYESMNIESPPAGWRELKARWAAEGQRDSFKEIEARRSEEDRDQTRGSQTHGQENARANQTPGRLDEDDMRQDVDTKPGFKTIHRPSFGDTEGVSSKTRRQSTLEAYKESRKMGEKQFEKELQDSGASRADARRTLTQAVSPQWSMRGNRSTSRKESEDSNDNQGHGC